MENIARASRITVFAAIFFAAMMLGMPSFLLNNGNSISPVGTAAAANGSRVFTVGQADFTASVTTLSPFLYTSAAEMMTIWPCYSMLMMYDTNGIDRIGDLAIDWSYTPDGLTWTFNLANNAYFIDPLNPTSTAHQVTAADVIYTFWQIQNYTNTLSSYFPGIIERMWADTPFVFNIELNAPYAPFVGALTTIPIIPKYYWQPHEKSGDCTKWTAAMPIGSGPWYYTLPGLPTTGEVVLQRNTIWFQELNRGWQIHVDTLKYKSETDDGTAWLELQQGIIDVMMGVPPSVYLETLPAEKRAGTMDGWAASTGFVYEYNLNQMTDELRADLHMAGSNNQLLQDPVVRTAMAMSVNKPDFITQVLSGLGSVADSLCPDVNPWYYHYPDPVAFNTAQARADLNAAGWAYDSTGAYDPSTTPLYKKSLSTGAAIDPLEFRFYSLTTGDDWMIGSTLIADWAAEAGVKLNLELLTYNQISSAWKSADYDVWLWDWMFSPTSDISTDIMSVLTTAEIEGGWSDIYWSNATFDALYNRSLLAMDPVARKAIGDQLQSIAYESFTCQLVAYRKELYAASLSTWTGYGNWSEQFTLMPDQLYPFLYMQLSPNGPDASPRNNAPQITSLAPYLETTKWFDQPFTGTATDPDTLQYTWFWGDGSAPTGPLSSPGTTHNFTKDGYYTVWFQAKEVGTADLFGTVGRMMVKVIDVNNRAPSSLSIGYTPASPNTGNVIQFTGSAIDLDGDPLYYSWDFGDTYSSLEQNPTHQYMTQGSYTAKLYVTDNHVGTLTRPVNTTSGGFVVVTENAMPSISVPDFGLRLSATSLQYNITASDSDNSLRLTWLWGDGSSSVTTLPTAWHTYTKKGTFTINVYADDLTGLSGHNATGSGVVTIYNTPTPPTQVSLTVNNSSPFQYELISFTGKAKDVSGEDLRYTFKFGDGTYANVDTVATNQVVTVVAPHWYLTAGTKSAYLYVSDGQSNVSTTVALVITVRALNQPPSVTPLEDVTGDQGQTLSFSATAWDPDFDDTLNYTWNFGDGSALIVGDSVTHAYAAAGTYTFSVYVSDGQGHNVTSSATASIAFVLNLASGWNFVSIPIVGGVYNASTLGLSTGDSVSGWNSATGMYDKNYFVGISPLIMDFVLSPSTGYWIYAGGPRTLHLYGDVPTTTQIRSITVPATGGWATVGFESLDTTMHASAIPSMYSGGSITTVVTYIQATGLYSTWFSVAPSVNNFLLVPGQSYWIWCSASGTLTYDP
jgi:ABC-type transport system substrate-binding protein/PKD repeat protein